jgi:hypothetical protein
VTQEGFLSDMFLNNTSFDPFTQLLLAQMQKFIHCTLTRNTRI